jgi:hypothetical protein
MTISRRSWLKKSALTLCLVAGMTAHAAPPVLVRWSGQAPGVPATPAPAGALLNPNFNYWGDALFARAKIAFEGQDLPADGRFAKWISATKGGSLTVTFPQPYALNELALHLKGEGTVTVETAAGTNEPPAWEKALEQGKAVDVPLAAKDEYWARLQLPKPVTAARWRITLGAGVSAHALTLWGAGPSTPPEPVGGEVRKKFPVAFESLPGADTTTMSDHIYWSWQRPLLEDKKLAEAGAVWAQHNKWARMAAAPILPPRETLNQPVEIVMAQNEHEGALLTLTSLKDQAGKPIHDSGIYKEFQPGAQEFRIKLGAVRGPTPAKVKVTLRVAGTLRTQLWGVVPGPLFATDNKPSAALMLKYLTNGRTIADYPLIALPPCGSQIFWLEVQTDGAKPGVYTTSLAAEPGPSVPVKIEVLPVTLPTPRVWVHSWSQGTVATTWPFEPESALAETVADKISRGISSFSGVPTAGTEAAEARRQKKDVYFFYNYIIPNGGSGKPWVSHGWGNQTNDFYNLTAKDYQVISNHVVDVVRQYREAGVDYGDWVGEPWDEPGNGEIIQIVAKWVKDVDPKVQFYCNAAFPTLDSFKKMSAVSHCFVPFWGNWFKDPQKEWQAEVKPGRINALYAIQGCNRAELHEELVGHYRILPWHAFKLGLNGWGFYAYYGPREDPYTDYDPPGSETDYQVVYPGPRGPVPSRQAEAYRDGWEDYRLLTLLVASGKPEAKKAIEEACAQIPMNREPLTGTGRQTPVDFEAIRLRLLKTAAALQPAGTGQ